MDTKVAYHCEEEAELRVQGHQVTVAEDELFLAVFLRRQHDVDLLRRHRQHRKLDTIELVEAAPRARLGESCNICTQLILCT